MVVVKAGVAVGSGESGVGCGVSVTGFLQRPLSVMDIGEKYSGLLGRAKLCEDKRIICDKYYVIKSYI